MPPDLRSNVEKSDFVLNFLKSEEFNKLITGILAKETSKLQQEITNLRNEVNILKESNIQLIHLLVNNNANATCLKNYQSLKEASSISYSETLQKGPRNDTQKSVRDSPKINTGEKPSTKDKEKVTNTTNINNDNEWKTITKKKKENRKINAIRGSDKSATSLKGAVQFSHYHVFRLEPTITSDNIIQHLNSKKINDVKCEQLQSKHPTEYSSFKVSVPATFSEEIMKPETWPENVCINRFLHRLSIINIVK